VLHVLQHALLELFATPALELVLHVYLVIMGRNVKIHAIQSVQVVINYQEHVLHVQMVSMEPLFAHHALLNAMDATQQQGNAIHALQVSMVHPDVVFVLLIVLMELFVTHQLGHALHANLDSTDLFANINATPNAQHVINQQVLVSLVHQVIIIHQLVQHALQTVHQELFAMSQLELANHANKASMDLNVLKHVTQNAVHVIKIQEIAHLVLQVIMDRQLVQFNHQIAKHVTQSQVLAYHVL